MKLLDRRLEPFSNRYSPRGHKLCQRALCMVCLRAEVQAAVWWNKPYSLLQPGPGPTIDAWKCLQNDKAEYGYNRKQPEEATHGNQRRTA